MSLFVAEQRQRRKGGSYVFYYSLRGNYWDREKQATQQVYIASLGRNTKISESEARDIAAKATDKLGQDITVEDLHDVRGLEIVSES